MISIFFSLFSLFVSIVILGFSLFNSIQYSPYIFLWLSVALVPVFLILHNHICEDRNIVITPMRLILWFFSIVGIGFFGTRDIIIFLLITIAFWIFFMRRDVRVLFIISLLFAGATIYTLLLSYDDIAEKIALYVYYSLLLGMCVVFSRSLLDEKLEQYLPTLSFPSWWEGYIEEIEMLIVLMVQILPLIVLGLITWGVSPWGYLVSIDIQLIGALTLLYLISASLSNRGEDPSISRYILPILVIFSFLITWRIFSSVFIVQIILSISLLIGIIIFQHYREYVKNIAKKIISP